MQGTYRDFDGHLGACQHGFVAVMKSPSKGGRVTWFVRHCRANSSEMDLRSVPVVGLYLRNTGDIVWTTRMQLLAITNKQITEKVRQ